MVRASELFAFWCFIKLRFFPLTLTWIISCCFWLVVASSVFKDEAKKQKKTFIKTAATVHSVHFYKHLSKLKHWNFTPDTSRAESSVCKKGERKYTIKNNKKIVIIIFYHLQVSSPSVPFARSPFATGIYFAKRKII